MSALLNYGPWIVIAIELTTNTTGIFCISLALLFICLYQIKFSAKTLNVGPKKTPIFRSIITIKLNIINILTEYKLYYNYTCRIVFLYVRFWWIRTLNCVLFCRDEVKSYSNNSRWMCPTYTQQWWSWPICDIKDVFGSNLCASLKRI